MDQTLTQRRELDRDLLRRAGEHLGTLAEQAREQFIMAGGRHNVVLYGRMAKFDRLSREVLEIANGK